jgi:hypothetical protein
MIELMACAAHVRRAQEDPPSLSLSAGAGGVRGLDSYNDKVFCQKQVALRERELKSRLQRHLYGDISRVPCGRVD